MAQHTPAFVTWQPSMLLTPLTSTGYSCVKFLSVYLWAPLVAQRGRTPLPMEETQVRSLGWEDPLAIHSSIRAWEILWTEEPGVDCQGIFPTQASNSFSMAQGWGGEMVSG